MMMGEEDRKRKIKEREREGMKQKLIVLLPPRVNKEENP